MSNDAATPPTSTSSLSQIAQRFVEARRAGASLPDFPGQIPDDLVTAYQVQDIAISQWDDQVIGWKVGYIAAERRDHSGDERLLGPIFSHKLWNATGGTTEFPIYEGGFGAVEAEYVLRLDADAPSGQTHFTPDEAAHLPATLFIGVEIASSPLATINKLGPRVVISDFGNNNGLILGPEVTDWLARDESALTAETLIDDQLVGTGGATTLPGGLRAAYAFALGRSARRGRPLKRGDLIATGNATGIHDIEVGQHALIRFAGIGDISCTAVSAK
ncbi:2-keto-4-pentenoate hydratase [Xanthomonas arboricola pv. juglandis]|uniref:2-keto-4-pentenoate hydratase n=1 Tax=Xanthomonas arboricola TaxID=56448 RepID=UPI00063EA067|nr:2-keto-4-pentenoate hydratase [Xanthomonas arboricola]MDN0220153.1 2-keto-4-pentenoate hydratase [Xanthomonas arboricola pv. juglandis]MDN0224622.1 2-keto-4-pentenoate hydratase [Xanthomonas arboricola pv. juglandis]MDN0228780.1 2-keto-4-pentenoate hydratase [Xanthomonas arboricola pv. juglandis]MDN0231975.1 2-keto-4-pentenoate hydratase [Xanthomonas arboricola pv. juglandis]MDN0236468.1 2-keto-4-pentenoate hydratase [Xanthomonas arboricola pv. juglandis]